ncbi:hypothetical protein [Polyangium jinanense]|uniref:Uncharacterized protein n=1 Tax=Polyangium jinanense TaxID=2829994 RepID=A0A9X3XB33_9BACT|nr:hypothetical protein [Polyangium jinanense]MDC3960654.1 hypothetical protein [Polyangium jinanense]MDC3986942.1 hypothetical protein [Polyangium jinanense]
MSENSVGKYTGNGVVDASPFKHKLVDVKHGEMSKLKRSKPGCEGVIADLATAIPAHGSEARIHADWYAEILEIKNILGEIRAQRPEADKLAEVLRESEAYYEDKLEALISRIGKAVVDTAKEENKPGLLATFESTLQYRAQYAEKSAATRRKNQQKPPTGTEEPPKGA